MISDHGPSGAVKVTHNESIKAAIPTLAGTIGATLLDAAAERFIDDDAQFLKFHGIYQQDDRDARKGGKKYIMMVRGRIPGGVMTPAQWLVFDDLSATYGNNTLRLTTRQSIQFHGVVKSGLGALVKRINEALLSTLAACGDVNRNVMASPTPARTEAQREVHRDCVRVADALRPQTRAYHAIWIDGVQLDLEAAEHKNFVDPLYGATYLPRKFKTAFVIPPVNDIDVFTNDLGFIAIVEQGRLVGYNVAVGGGMGRSHGNVQTYPRLADVLGFVLPERVVEVAKAVLTVHRDFGDRTDRKRARLKYVLEERGADWARGEIERRAGFALEPARAFRFTTTQDVLGWREQADGRWFLTLFVESGRVKDIEGGRRLKSALRRLAQALPSIEFRLSANQNVMLVNVPPAGRGVVETLLREHGVATTDQATVLHAGSMACPALPTCGLSLAEAERYLPGLIDRIERLCAEVGLGGEEMTIRMTGCPNGCARPYVAELAFVGKAPGRYQVWVGADAAGTRLNRLWKDVVKDAEMEAELRPLLARFVAERTSGERFGDWAARALWSDAPAPVV